MLDYVVRKLIEFGYERALRQTYLGRLRTARNRSAAGHLDALPARAQRPGHLRGVRPLPDRRADRQRDGRSGPASRSSCSTAAPSSCSATDQLEAVIAHEVGHILSDHVLYRTALQILLRLGSQRLPMVAGMPLMAVQHALLEWSRATELTCDRAAAIVTRDPRVVCKMLMTMSAGAKADDLNLDAFMRQAMEYTETGEGLDRLQRLLTDLRQTHSLPVKRVHELLAWVRDRRVRPHRGRGVRPPRRGAPRARRGGRRRDALLRALQGPLPRDRRARQLRRQAALGLAEEIWRRGQAAQGRRSPPPSKWTSRRPRFACWAASSRSSAPRRTPIP